jgi:hypothetical protein
VPAADATTPVLRADRAPAQPAATGGDRAAAETGLAVAPLAAPAAIRIEPIESAEPSAITSLTNDPLVVPPLDVETGSAGQEERP